MRVCVCSSCQLHQVDFGRCVCVYVCVPCQIRQLWLVNFGRGVCVCVCVCSSCQLHQLQLVDFGRGVCVCSRCQLHQLWLVDFGICVCVSVCLSVCCVHVHGVHCDWIITFTGVDVHLPSDYFRTMLNSIN